MILSFSFLLNPYLNLTNPQHVKIYTKTFKNTDRLITTQININTIKWNIHLAPSIFLVNILSIGKKYDKIGIDSLYFIDIDKKQVEYETWFLLYNVGAKQAIENILHNIYYARIPKHIKLCM